MNTSRGYKDLAAWQCAVDLSEAVYRHTKHFPREEVFGLTSQIRRAAVSVAANLAEGAGRNTKGEFMQFIGIARGSLSELETLVLICTRLQYLSPNDSDNLMAAIDQIGRMTLNLKRALAGTGKR